MTKCDQCRSMWAERSEREGTLLEPPCATCRVILLEENADAAKIYNIVRGQLICLGENIVDLNHLALWEAIDRYKVKEPVRCFEMVNKVFHEFLSRERDAG